MQRKSNTKYLQSFAQGLMTATSLSVLEINSQGVILQANRTACRTFSLQPGDLLTKVIPSLGPRASKILKNDQPSPDMNLQFNDRKYLVRFVPIPTGNDSFTVLCTLEDRTEIEEIFKQMQRYKELSRELNTIISSSDDGLWVCDAKGKVLRINAASERINTVQAEDVLGREMSDLQKDGFIDRSVTLDVLKTKRRQTILQQTRSGRKLMITGNPVFNDVGELIRVVVNERDITEIDVLTRRLKEQVAIKDKMRHQLLEIQLSDITSDSMIARSPNMVKVIHQAFKLGQVRTTVLISGESGTGKGIIANLIHKHSERAKNPMIALNCGAIPENLLETELFGYQKGAFTGADQKGKPGYIELAHRGTLFLDEIAELPLSSQVKLLRFLENGRITRVGSTMTRTVDVRIIGATHQNLEEMVEEGRFRKDLFYRLHVIPIHVPPLRERRECILPLVQHYIEHFGNQVGRKGKTTISREAMDALLAYKYPGNVRELLNMCERLVVMTEGREIGLDDLPASIMTAVDRSRFSTMGKFQQGQTLAQMLADAERRILADARRQYRSQSKMAEALGVNQSTIARKLKKYDQKSSP
jgi:PAS domain S-box-containing protein